LTPTAHVRVCGLYKPIPTYTTAAGTAVDDDGDTKSKITLSDRSS